jgi:hypothetical protein
MYPHHYCVQYDKTLFVNNGPFCSALKIVIMEVRNTRLIDIAINIIIVIYVQDKT